MINKIKSWKAKHLMYIPQDNALDNSDEENNDDADDGDDGEDGEDVIGKAWWRGFCWCHRNSFCDDWCMVCNFKLMYEKVYACMVDCGIAIKWMDGPKWYNNDEAVVDKEEDAFGRRLHLSSFMQRKCSLLMKLGRPKKMMGTKWVKNFLCALIAKNRSGQPLRTAISWSLGSHQQQVHQF